MTTPRCPYFGECGGCTQQHIEYTTQVENKKNFVIAELTKKGLTLPADVPVFSGSDYEYRNRMDFVFFAGGLGFRQRGQFNRMVAIDKCAISNPKLNSLLSEVWHWYKNTPSLEPFDLKKYNGTLKYAVIRTPEFSDDSTISFILNDDSPSLAKHYELIKEFALTTTAKNVVVGTVGARQDLSLSPECFEVKGTTTITEKLLGKTITFSSQSFFQNNSRMAQEMVRYCVDLLKKYDTRDSTFVDLYGGAGTFGICVGDLFAKLIIIDNAELNISCAKENLTTNNLPHGEAIFGDAKTLAKIETPGKLFMLVDPPRTGMDKKVIDLIVQRKPAVLVYVSCNPEQLARELPHFVKDYKITSLAVFDLFPQTNHVECVVGMERV